MGEMEKIEKTVQNFISAFSKLSPDEKRYFIAAIDKELKAKGNDEKGLYLSLIKAAREGKSAEKIIEELKSK